MKGKMHVWLSIPQCRGMTHQPHYMLWGKRPHARDNALRGCVRHSVHATLSSATMTEEIQIDSQLLSNNAPNVLHLLNTEGLLPMLHLQVICHVLWGGGAIERHDAQLHHKPVPHLHTQSGKKKHTPLLTCSECIFANTRPG